jgi:hypothetical protein
VVPATATSALYSTRWRWLYDALMLDSIACIVATPENNTTKVGKEKILLAENQKLLEVFYSILNTNDFCNIYHEK